MKKTLLLISILSLFFVQIFAQAVEEVTLTVSGDGATKTEATQLALRSAIEQAFGVFVSANTQILNDELVKDEIATVSSGNIKAYKEIADIKLPNGNTSVTLQATVSISKLITYAQTKGSSAEFAGATFGMNMKLKKLNKANEEKAIENMIAQFEALMWSMFNYELELGEPNAQYKIPAKVRAIPNENSKMIINILLNTLKSLALSNEEVKDYEQLKLSFEKLEIGTSSSSSGNILMNNRYNNGNTLSYALRSKVSYDLLYYFFNVKIYQAIYNFKIIDNLGENSMINLILKKENYRNNPPPFSIKASGLIIRLENTPRPVSWHDVNRMSNGLEIPYLLENHTYGISFIVSISENKIEMYNNFTVTPKDENER